MTSELPTSKLALLRSLARLPLARRPLGCRRLPFPCLALTTLTSLPQPIQGGLRWEATAVLCVPSSHRPKTQIRACTIALLTDPSVRGGNLLRSTHLARPVSSYAAKAMTIDLRSRV